jgi:triosephosphate isomerase
MNKPLIAGNWKMHHTANEALGFAGTLGARLAPRPDADVWVFPSFPLLGQLAAAFAETDVHVGAQNMHWEERGAFTGEVSAMQIRDAGGRGVILGHSERRHVFGETDDAVNRKVLAALAGGLVPFFCVGETLDQREKGATADVVLGQITEGLGGLGPEGAREIIVAYEPVWAIGTGKTASPDQAGEVHRLIRGALSERFGTAGDEIRILYGGSVKPSNIGGLMEQPDIHGCLVGGASLEADSFADIVFGAV